MNSACDYILNWCPAKEAIQPQNCSFTFSLNDIYRVESIVLLLEFPICCLITALNFILLVVYRKKTNFLLRLHTYLTVPTALLLGICLLYSIPGLKEDKDYYKTMVGFCDAMWFYIEGCIMTVWFAVMVLSYTVCVALTTKLYNCTHCLRRHCRNNCVCCLRRQCCKHVLEVLFVVVLISLSLLIAGIRYYLRKIDYGFEDFADAFDLDIIVPIAVVVAWSPLVIGNITLLVWYCFRRRHILTRGFRTILKEIAMFVVLLLIAIIVGLFSGVPINITDLSKRITVEMDPVGLQLIFASFLTVFPLCVSLYLWCTFRTTRTPGNRVRFENLNNRNDPLEQQTAPLSRRVSLPTDTAAHAPNFLSPSTAGPTEATRLL